MVDFVKGKTSHPVGAGLAFPRGFNEKVVTPSGEVWLKTGVVETDKSKFDVDLWRRPALFGLVYGSTPVDTAKSTPRVFTEIAMGKANGKRAILFITGNGNSIYGSFDDGATVIPVSTNDMWINQKFVFWYKDRFFIQTTSSSGVQSMTWDGTTLGAPVAESWLNTVLAGSHISCMDAIGDKLVLGTSDGKLFISTDGITLSPCTIWNSSTQKTAVGTCAIKDVAISKTVDAIAAVGWSSARGLAFINQIDNVFSGSGTVLKHITSLNNNDDTIINTDGRWICNIWTWVNDPSEKVSISTLTSTISSIDDGPYDHVYAGEQTLFCRRGSTSFYISDSNTFNYTAGITLLTAQISAVVGVFYKAAVDIEDRLLVSISADGNRICRNFGIVGGTLADISAATHVRIK